MHFAQFLLSVFLIIYLLLSAFLTRTQNFSAHCYGCQIFEGSEKYFSVEVHTNRTNIL